MTEYAARWGYLVLAVWLGVCDAARVVAALTAAAARAVR